jgi:hypothetical protein
MLTSRFNLPLPAFSRTPFVAEDIAIEDSTCTRRRRRLVNQRRVGGRSQWEACRRTPEKLYRTSHVFPQDPSSVFPILTDQPLERSLTSALDALADLSWWRPMAQGVRRNGSARPVDQTRPRPPALLSHRRLARRPRSSSIWRRFTGHKRSLNQARKNAARRY